MATTRPETMLGDVAVVVIPDDERYSHLVGRKVMLPIRERPIPILADEYVEREFGTGCVKVTPAHDFNDYKVSERHRTELPDILSIFSLDARVTDDPASGVPQTYRGLDRFVARGKIILELEGQGFLAQTKPHRLMVPRGRSY